MNASRSLDLADLRRQLEEILAMVSADSSFGLRVDLHPPDLNRNGSASENGAIQSDQLFDKALAVVTEFGQPSPAILQMWLGIDYARAVRLLNRFEEQGLVSSKGRVRHKAYELRRSRECQGAQVPTVRDETVSR
jgi:DNA segregation ATPase FtsK/SpoIIIE-like protein